jgi:Ca-activated chloride channel family protein
MRHATLSLVGALFVLFGSNAAGRLPDSQPASSFRGGVDLVALDVCVKDRNGRPTAGLNRDDFLILDNNVPQQIALFTTADRVPLAVSLLVDTSQSMAGAPLDRAKAAAAAFIASLGPDDLVEVISFNDTADIRYRLGADHYLARLSLNDLWSTGMTALYQTVLASVRGLERAQQDRSIEYRNVVIALTDGENTRGRLAFDDMLDAVRRSGVIVYTVSLRTERRHRSVVPGWQMAQLAHDTGGRALAVRDPEDLTGMYQEIGAELHHLYRIGYVPTPIARDGSWRRISVRVSNRDVVVRTRSGYFAPRAAPARSHQ